jgi:hypothetical protein
LHQETLDHHCEINAVIFWTDKAYRAMSPTVVFKELCIVTTVILVAGIKGH